MRGRGQLTDQSATDQPTEQAELVADLREQDAHAEASRLLAGALERIRAWKRLQSC